MNCISAAKIRLFIAITLCYQVLCGCTSSPSTPLPSSPQVSLVSSDIVTNEPETIVSGLVELNYGVEVQSLGTAKAGIPTVERGIWKCLVTELAAGDNTIVVKLTSPTGTVQSLPLTVKRTASAPLLKIDSIPPFVKTTRMQIQGRATPGNSVEIVLDAAISVVGTVASDGTWSIALDGLREGVNILTITSRDSAGNMARQHAVIRLKTSPPLISVPSSISTRAMNYRLSGSVEPWALVSLTAAGETTPRNIQVTGEVWSTTLTGLAPGNNNYLLTVVDRADNSVQVPVTITVPPAEIIAHRGESTLAPENTLAAINLAWLRGVTSVEIDVYLTTDNRLVVIHDESTMRTAGVDYVVWSSPSALLRTLDVGRFMGSQFTGEKIPFLEEVLASLPAGRKLWIEIKSGPEIVPFLKKVIYESGKDKQVVLHSFKQESLTAAHAELAAIPCYMATAVIGNVTDFLREVVANGFAGILVDVALIDEALITAAHDAGIEIHGWTVDDIPTFLALDVKRIDGVITNRPSVLRP